MGRDVRVARHGARDDGHVAERRRSGDPGLAELLRERVVDVLVLLRPSLERHQSRDLLGQRVQRRLRGLALRAQLLQLSGIRGDLRAEGRGRLRECLTDGIGYRRVLRDDRRGRRGELAPDLRVLGAQGPYGRMFVRVLRKGGPELDVHLRQLGLQLRDGRVGRDLTPAAYRRRRARQLFADHRELGGGLPSVDLDVRALPIGLGQ